VQFVFNLFVFATCAGSPTFLHANTQICFTILKGTYLHSFFNLKVIFLALKEAEEKIQVIKNSARFKLYRNFIKQITRPKIISNKRMVKKKTEVVNQIFYFKFIFIE